MKGLKITALILTTALCAAAFTACKNEKKPVSSGINVISSQSQGGAGVNGENKATIDPNAASNNYVFKYNGVDIVVNSPMNAILGSLGNNYSYFEAASCAGQGISKFYTFNGGSFVVSTNPVGNEDSIAMITINDDSVSTAEGIFIGNTVEQLKAAYGEPKENDGTTYTYEKGSSVLVFLVDDSGKITNIIYNAKV